MNDRHETRAGQRIMAPREMAEKVRKAIKDSPETYRALLRVIRAEAPAWLAFETDATMSSTLKASMTDAAVLCFLRERLRDEVAEGHGRVTTMLGIMPDTRTLSRQQRRAAQRQAREVLVCL